MIRYAVRRWGLGWLNMLCLALALAVAEECLIQQTSLSPMVLQLKGEAARPRLRRELCLSPVGAGV